MQYLFEVYETKTLKRRYVVEADDEAEARSKAADGETLAGGETTLCEVSVVDREVGELVDCGSDVSRPQTINLGVHGIVLSLHDSSGTIISDLHTPDDDTEAGDGYNAMIDGIESMILAHAVAGVPVDSPAYLEGLETAIAAIANHA